MTDTLGVIGVGNMGSALVKGWVRAGRSGMLVWDTYQPAVDRLLADVRTIVGEADSTTVVAAADSFEQLVDAVDIVVLLVKPKDARDLLAVLRGVTRDDQVVISAMAGLALDWLREELGPGPALLRVMPNLAVELRAGAVAVATEEGLDRSVLGRVLALFSQTGIAEALPEDLFDVFTAVSGSSPAFLAIAIEGLEDGAVAAGLSRTDARRVVRQAALETARGATDLTGSQPSSGSAELPEEKSLELAFRDAVAAAMERSRQMRSA